MGKRTAKRHKIMMRARDCVLETAGDQEQRRAGGEGALDDAFFYESPFPPEVALDDLEPKPLPYSPEMIARRRRLRTFVAMVVGVAAVILVMGWGKSRGAVETTQPRSMTVPVSP